MIQGTACLFIQKINRCLTALLNPSPVSYPRISIHQRLARQSLWQCLSSCLEARDSCYHCLDVLDGNLRGTVDSDIGVDSAALLEVDNGGAAQALGSSSAESSAGLGENNGSEVAESNEAAVLLEVLDNPLSVLTAQD